MEKYIQKAVFILTIIIIYLPPAFAGCNKQEILKRVASTIANDRGYSLQKFYLKDSKPNDRSVKKRLVNFKNGDNLLTWDGDTGKYYRKFFFKDATGVNKRFIDSLLLKLERDSTLRRFRLDDDSIFMNRGGGLFMDRRDNSIEIPNMIRPIPHMRIDGLDIPGRALSPLKNSQSFSFRSTDKDGITTRFRIDVSEPSKEELEKVKGKVSQDVLKVQDLSFSPNFSSNTITLLFTLPDKGSAGIKIIDTNLKEIYSDTFSQFPMKYSKNFSLSKNGIYFLLIRQNNKSYVKKLIKQE